MAGRHSAMTGAAQKPVPLAAGSGYNIRLSV
jgi:hypothetical protein